MDPRIREHAEVIASHSVDLDKGDEVVIDAAHQSADLVAALCEQCADAGAIPLVIQDRLGDRFRRAYLQAHDGDFDLPDHQLALFEEMDAYIAIRGRANNTELGDVAPATQSDFEAARRRLLEVRLGKRWVVTQHPTPADAQLAGMSTEAYENFVWDAINKDWSAQREHQAQLVELLDEAEEIRIVSGDTTDVTMSLAGNEAVNDYGERNLPGGEVFTAPVPDSVDGSVLFDKPLYHQGREVDGVALVFEDGEVVEHGAERNEAVLTEILETDAGARRLGELGIGMNRDIDRFTYTMLFDEKMGDTVHMAVGRAYDETVGPANEANDSAVHVDMIVDMSEDSHISIDGDVIQRDGTFRFEEGFEA